MAFLHLIFDNFEFRDLGHSDFLSCRVLAQTQVHPFDSKFLIIMKFRLCLRSEFIHPLDNFFHANNRKVLIS